MMRFAFCLRVRAFTNPPIGQALAADPAQQFIGAHSVIHAKRHAVRPAKIELGKVALQMGFADA